MPTSKTSIPKKTRCRTCSTSPSGWADRLRGPRARGRRPGLRPDRLAVRGLRSSGGWSLGHVPSATGPRYVPPAVGPGYVPRRLAGYVFLRRWSHGTCHRRLAPASPVAAGPRQPAAGGWSRVCPAGGWSDPAPPVPGHGAGPQGPPNGGVRQDRTDGRPASRVAGEAGYLPRRALASSSPEAATVMLMPAPWSHDLSLVAAVAGRLRRRPLPSARSRRSPSRAWGTVRRTRHRDDRPRVHPAALSHRVRARTDATRSTGVARRSAPTVPGR